MQEIPLTKGMIAIVDDADFHWTNQHKWYAQSSNGKWYAARRLSRREDRNRKLVLLHRVLLNAAPDKDVDHRNGNTLDCRRENLRLCSESQNLHNRGLVKSRNKSGYKGVYFDKQRKKWRSRIMIDRKMIELGFFNTPEDASEAYNKTVREYMGEFAHSSVSN